MGGETRVLKPAELAPLVMADLPAGLRRRRPRSHAEWRTLREWGRLPAWEEDPPGCRLGRLREEAGLTQRQLASRLGRSQPSIAQAERWRANPTAAFMAAWARALGRRPELLFPARAPEETP